MNLTAIEVEQITETRKACAGDHVHYTSPNPVSLGAVYSKHEVLHDSVSAGRLTPTGLHTSILVEDTHV